MKKKGEYKNKMEEEQTVLTLNDDKEYVLVYQVKYEENDYVYLAEINNPNNIMFCLINENKLTKITDQALLGKLFSIVAKNIN